MAASLPNPNIDFVPLDVLTAEELNQMVENTNYLAGLFPLAGENIANGSIVSSKIATGAVGSTQLANSAVTTNKINNGAVTAAKLASGTIPWQKIADYTRPTTLGANSYFYVTVPSGYNHHLILASGEIIGGAPAYSWVDLRAYSSPPNNYEVAITRVSIDSGTVVGTTETGNAITSASGAGHTAFMLRAESTHTNTANYPAYVCHSGTPNQVRVGSAVIQATGELPTIYGISAQAGLKAYAHIEVWGSD